MAEVEDQYQPAPDQEHNSPAPLRKQRSFDGTKTTITKPPQPPRPKFARAKTISLPAERQMDKVASETQEQRKYHSLKRDVPIKPWGELPQPSTETNQLPNGEISEPIVDAPDSHVLTHSPSPTNTNTTESVSSNEDSPTPSPSPNGSNPTGIKTNSPFEEEIAPSPPPSVVTPRSPPPSVVTPRSPPPSVMPPSPPPSVMPPSPPPSVMPPSPPPAVVGDSEPKSSGPSTKPPSSPTQPQTSTTQPKTTPTRPIKLPPRPYPPPPKEQARYLEARLKKKRPPPPGPRVIDTRSTSTAKPTPTTDSSPSPTGNETRNLKIMQAEVSSFSSIPKRPPPPSNIHTTPTPSQPTPSQPKDESSITIQQASPKPPASLDDPTKPRGILKKNNTTPSIPSATSPVTSPTTAKVGFAEETESIDELQPLPSPREEKKLVSKMKSSFRNFTHRKKHVKDDPSASPPSSRRTIAGTRPAKQNNLVYDQKRYPDKLPCGIISPLVVQCVAYLNRPESLNEPGLFRIPGDMSIMKRYRASFARGEEVDLCSDCRDPHTVAGLLKLHFREQRQCLIPGDALMEKIVVAVRNKDVEEFRSLIETIDVKAQAGIRMVAELLKKVSENSEINHMTSGTLATSCGPSFFPRLGPSCANAVLKFLADNCDSIFSS